MDFQATLSQFDDNPLWSFHIPIPSDVSQAILSTGSKRVICKVNQLIEFPCALTSDGKGGYYVTLNKENRKKLKADTGDLLDVTILKDENDGMLMPEELEELLLQDQEGNHYFKKLTPGKQRSLIHLVAKPKGTDTRLKKAIVIVNYLKSTSGKLDFKELNEAFKNYNR